MIRINSKDKKRIKELCAQTAFDMAEKTEVLNYVKKYVNNSAHFCLTCDSAVRLMVNQLRNFNNTKLSNEQ